MLASTQNFILYTIKASWCLFSNFIFVKLFLEGGLQPYIFPTFSLYCPNAHKPNLHLSWKLPVDWFSLTANMIFHVVNTVLISFKQTNKQTKILLLKFQWDTVFSWKGKLNVLPCTPEQQLKASRSTKRSSSIWVTFSQSDLFVRVAQKRLQKDCGKGCDGWRERVVRVSGLTHSFAQPMSTLL